MRIVVQRQRARVPAAALTTIWTAMRDGLFGANAGALHHFRPTVEIGNEQPPELLGRAGAGVDTLTRKPLANIG